MELLTIQNPQQLIGWEFIYKDVNGKDSVYKCGAWSEYQADISIMDKTLIRYAYRFEFAKDDGNLHYCVYLNREGDKEGRYHLSNNLSTNTDKLEWSIVKYITLFKAAVTEHWNIALTRYQF
jgi:hypothetical protein